MVCTAVSDSAHKIFIGGLPSYLSEDQVCVFVTAVLLHLCRLIVVVFCGCCSLVIFQSMLSATLAGDITLTAFIRIMYLFHADVMCSVSFP